MQTHNVASSAEYSISANTKMFRVLSSGLYSDKVRAVLRELGTNAYDAHTLVGKEDIPFEVSLPTYNKPFFGIRDYGPGLSHDQAMHLYTTYGESSKVGDKKTTGCLGLGSKSPFAYVDVFLVISRHNGKKRIYIASFSSKQNTPSFEFIEEQDCTEPSGLEVKMKVSSIDRSTFQRRCSEVYMYFKTVPNFVDEDSVAENFKVESIFQYEIKPGSGVYVFPELRGPVAIQGNIGYPVLRLPPDVNLPVAVSFPNDSLGFAVSRESLEYTHETNNALFAGFKTAAEIIADVFEDKWIDEKTTYEKVSLLTSTDQVFTRAVKFIIEKYNHTSAVQRLLKGTIDQDDFPQLTARFLNPKSRSIKEVSSVSYRRTQSMIVVKQDEKLIKINKLREFFRTSKEYTADVILVLGAVGKYQASLYNDSFEEYTKDVLDGFPVTVLNYSDIAKKFVKVTRKTCKGTIGYSLSNTYHVRWDKTELTDPDASFVYILAEDFEGVGKRFLVGNSQVHFPPTKASASWLKSLGIFELIEGRKLYVIDKKFENTLPDACDDFNIVARDFLKKAIAIEQQRIVSTATSIFDSMTCGLSNKIVRNFVKNSMPGSLLDKTFARYTPPSTTISYKDYKKFYVLFDDLKATDLVGHEKDVQAEVKSSVDALRSEHKVIDTLLADRMYGTYGTQTWIEVLKLIAR